MIKTPNFLKKLMQSDAYSNKSNPDYENANKEVSKYFKTLYPGKMEFDATGRMKEPEFDMTLEQFENVQNQIDADFEEAKEEAENEIMGEFGEYFENLGIDFDIEQYVIPAETMVVNVLHPGGEILTKDLQFYDLEIPDFEKANKIWAWHSEQSESTCDECAKLDGQVFFDESELPECPIHPNCNCWIEESEIDENGNKIKTGKYIKTDSTFNKEEKMNPNQMKLGNKGLNFIKAHENIKGFDIKTGLYKPYDDGYGIETIGYGHKIQETENFDTGISEKQVSALFKQDLRIAENVVKNYIDSPINQNQFDALVSLAYNIGNRNFRDSTIRQQINNSDFNSKKYPTLESAWKAWNISQGQVSKGLINRRKDEWDLYKTGNYQISTAG